MNTLTIVTGYGSIKPMPWRKAYLNVSQEAATQRFYLHYPTARDVSVTSFQFDDELSIGATGVLSSSYQADQGPE